MQKDEFKKILKKIIKPNSERDLIAKHMLKIAEETRENIKKSREYHETFRSLADWMSAQSKSVSDLNYNQKTKIMKFTKNTWMPIDEAHFADITSEDGKYQYNVYQKALSHCKTKDVAIDIGANIGLFTRQMSADFAEVHAFEPQSIARSCIFRNTPNNNVTVYSFGLGETEGSVILNSSSTAIGGAFIKFAEDKRDKILKSESLAHETIFIRKLDGFHFTKIDLVKIDVQGYEIDVLKGGKETFKKHKPTLILEAGGKVEAISGVNPKDALDYAVSELGYKIKEVVNKDYILTF